MSLPSYKKHKNKKLYMEMQAGSASPPQPYIPSTEKGVVGNQLRTPETVRAPETSKEHDTAPSMNSGGPIRQDTNGWYDDILSKFRQDMKKPAPERNASLGDLGMKGVSNATFGSQPGATEPGDTPLVSGGVPVTDMKGQFDWNLNEIASTDEAPVGINPAAPVAPSGQATAINFADKMFDALARSQNIMILQKVHQYINQKFDQLYNSVDKSGNRADMMQKKNIQQTRQNFL